MWIAYIFHWSYSEILSLADWERELFAKQALEVAQAEAQNNMTMQQIITKALGGRR